MTRPSPASQLVYPLLDPLVSRFYEPPLQRDAAEVASVMMSVISSAIAELN